MSTELAIREGQATFDSKQLAALEQLGVSGASRADQAIFFHQCVRTGLDPFARQIYMIKRKQWDSDRRETVEKQTIQTGIDGFRLIARRAADKRKETLGYADTLWCGEDGQWRDVWLPTEPPAAAKVTVYRDGQPFPAVALMREFRAAKKDGTPMAQWASKPVHMIAKCAEALALRMAFPQDLSGLYTTDEMGEEPPETVASRADSPAAERSGSRRMSRKKAEEPVDAEIVEPSGLDEFHPDTTSNPGSAAGPQAGAESGEESLFDSGPAPAAPAEPSITSAQQKILHALLNENDMGDRETALAWISVEIGRGIDSSKDLTKAEASLAIDALNKLGEPS